MFFARCTRRFFCEATLRYFPKCHEMFSSERRTQLSVSRHIAKYILTIGLFILLKSDG